jgi:uncharacterized CHY-type Zn-finger protein
MKTFSKNDNSFICAHCKKNVSKLGYTSRNHCPQCLHSVHVDIIPGDRQNECQGIMQPVDIELSAKKGKVIVHKCLKCGMIKKNVSAQDDSETRILAVINQSQKFNKKN